MVQIKLKIGLGSEKKPITSLLSSKNKEGSLHCMLADCSRCDAECAARDRTKSLSPRRAALLCIILYRWEIMKEEVRTLEGVR